MFLTFPTGTRARVVEAYEQPYADPITVAPGDVVVPDLERSKTTDIAGWIWCQSPDSREGWTPRAWIDRDAEPWRMTRPFSALELSVRLADEVELLHSESGFVVARTADGREGWLPHGVLELI